MFIVYFLVSNFFVLNFQQISNKFPTNKMRRGGRTNYKSRKSKTMDDDNELFMIILLVICSVIIIFIVVFVVIYFTEDMHPKNKTFEFLLKDDEKIEPKQMGILGRFKNISPYMVELWWYTPYSSEEIRSFGHIPPNGGVISFTTYTGHKFFYSKPGEERDKSKRMNEFIIRHYRTLYIYKDNKFDGHNIALYDETLDELWFLYNYYKKNNKHWISPYLRPKPKLKYIKFKKRKKNRKIRINNEDNYWICDHGNMCRNKTETILYLEQINKKFPKIYRVKNFINKFEAKHIINIAKDRATPSMIGGGNDAHVDPTRVSKSVWLSMNKTRIFNTIYARLGTVFNINKQRMTIENALNYNDNNDISNCGVASHLEVEFFDKGGFYESHFDNDVSGGINLNFITAQIVLEISEDIIGGESFFRAGINSTNNNIGITIKNEQYSLLFWYNLLNDGNLDEHTMYANKKVIQGNQVISHMTVWDPCLPSDGAPGARHSDIFKDEL